MDVFALREQLINAYSEYASSFIRIRDSLIKDKVTSSLKQGQYWPEPLIQLNPRFDDGDTIPAAIADGLLHKDCERIFLRDKDSGGQTMRLHRHQREAIEVAKEGHNYILTTGTGSGKSLAYIVPIVDHVLRRGSGKGIQAIIVYPINALVNSQINELEKYLHVGFAGDDRRVTFKRYTRQEDDEERERILQNPPDILLTNYVMLDLIMTRRAERDLIKRAQGLRFLVLDELHTYRGRQGADVALLMRRARNRLETGGQLVQFVGTSATLSSEGTLAEQQREIANVGTQIFGAPVLPEHIIGETLKRNTPTEYDVDALRRDVTLGDALSAPSNFDDFVRQPLSIWIEETFGLQEIDGRLARQEPRSIEDAAEVLSKEVDADSERCATVIRKWLLAGYRCEPDCITGHKPFAFRLHQFISPGDTVSASMEAEAARYVTLNGQHFVPGDRRKLLFPLCFCRECGQEYYTVRKTPGDEETPTTVAAREFRDQASDDGVAGYLFISTEKPWSDSLEALQERVPDDWLEERRGRLRVKYDRRKYLPQRFFFSTAGEADLYGQECVFMAAPFRFCLNCGVSYSGRQGDFGKLATLSSEGRSSATTILSLSAIRSLKNSDFTESARKLLSFTDNRQDASLQAGHFNDFIEVSLLRGAIYRAVESAGESGLRHEEIAKKVFDALDLPLALYASDPEAHPLALEDVQHALRQVLGYRLYRDLRRGWRIALPNLEQCGLLKIDYARLDKVCLAEDIWEGCHPALADASPETRIRIAHNLLDHLRRELAIKVDYLDRNYQDSIQQLSSQYLREPWALDESEYDNMERASVALPRARRGDDSRRSYTYVSARGAFGRYLRTRRAFDNYGDAMNMEETQEIIRQLLEGMRVAGLVSIVWHPKSENEVPGYQLKASAMRWRMGDGASYHDDLRVTIRPEDAGSPNPFFVAFYRGVANTIADYRSREHTAQVPGDERQAREKAFRKGTLPILYCSPTMELGVDIAELNVVNMRNVPPTPANYAQRSGRAGRSGQPALIFTYCAARSPHDQYFFKSPERMVAGSVAPPRLDLTNEDLLQSHIHAIWLAETGQSLGKSLIEILDVEGDEPSLALLPGVKHQIEAKAAQQDARERAASVLRTITELDDPDSLLDQTMDNIVQQFDRACDRWRHMYKSARKQVKVQEKIRLDQSRSQRDKQQADRLRREALSQIDLLTNVSTIAQSDFYSYRYFATEGFLPGYSFPRLPLSAYIPARKTTQADSYLSRPRFLAISEFGPRAIIYHEGSRYIINRVTMPVGDDGEGPLMTQIKQCGHCGYIHSIGSEVDYDLCQRCGEQLELSLTSLLRMQNVSTKRRDRISADEEERLRFGYELRTGLRFGQKHGEPDVLTAQVNFAGEDIAILTYAPTAALWRINLGWRRRENKQQYGFMLDTERGYWSRNDKDIGDKDDPQSETRRRVIPYVEDSRNCLLFEPLVDITTKQMASLQAALKRAIETRFQLEESELAAEPLPDRDSRQQLLFFEAAEGGAGVLRQLLDDPEALREVALEALEICHFDRETGADLKRATGAEEDCEAACYDCLLSYRNQLEHSILDRKCIDEWLLKLRDSNTIFSPSSVPRDEHFMRLLNRCESDLERKWLETLANSGMRLPDKAQPLIEACTTQPDFLYESGGTRAAIYIDGSHHDYPQRQARDRAQSECMDDIGYRVIRFSYRDNWEAIFGRFKYIFGG